MNELKEKELKTCPFCGAPFKIKNLLEGKEVSIVSRILHENKVWSLKCTNSSCILGSGLQVYAEKEELIKRLNRRANPST